MGIKRFILSSLLAVLIFIAGVLVGKYILSPPVEIVVVNVEKLTTLIEKFNVQADEIKKDMAMMKEWNENALIEEPEVSHRGGTKEEKK